MSPRRSDPTVDLFSGLATRTVAREALDEGAVILRGFASAEAGAIFEAVQRVVAVAPFRQMVTPGGRQMSVAMTNCGSLGWVTDLRGYRYQPIDPLSGHAWPALPEVMRSLAGRAAETAGYADFAPDACLVNRYVPGARLTLHQDRNERDWSQPVVSVSLGLPAVFLWGGPERAGKVRRIRLESGDVVVWGGPTRLTFHGVEPLVEGEHPLTGPCRINLTFRKAA